jgi:hypothetical protein
VGQRRLRRGRGPHRGDAEHLVDAADLRAGERVLDVATGSGNAALDLRAGRVDAAADQFEHAWALACHLDDPCWEGMAARGLGLLSAVRGDHAGATAWLAEAHTRCNRATDRYQWVSAYVLDTIIGTALDHHDETQAAPLVDALASLAARGGMRELVVRAHLHRAAWATRRRWRPRGCWPPASTIPPSPACSTATTVRARP